MKLSRLFRGKADRKSRARQLFDAVTAQSRRPDLYLSDGISDSFEGRFEAITLHSALLMRRLRQITPDGKPLYDQYGEIVFSSFDHAYREIGTGDLLVGKKMRKLGESYIGRIKAYDDALEQSVGTLEDVLNRNLFEGRSGVNEAGMAEYIRHADECLAKQTDESLLRGQIDWPEPSEFLTS
ncbi:MAG: ubiquinol-cytochrome C chaperone [Ponticaulis sp.]|nr:ubiquinol-cytochrome C chaperone [Ponticaulis sp.]